jgi:hypothetical protein
MTVFLHWKSEWCYQTTNIKNFLDVFQNEFVGVHFVFYYIFIYMFFESCHARESYKVPP